MTFYTMTVPFLLKILAFQSLLPVVSGKNELWSVPIPIPHNSMRLEPESRVKRDIHFHNNSSTTISFDQTTTMKSVKIKKLQQIISKDPGTTSLKDNVLNTTETTLNFTGKQEELKSTPWWQELLDKTQLVMAICGFIANIVTVITLVKNGKSFSPAIRVLFRHQSVVDAWACLFGALVLVQPFMWLPGSYYLDVFICYAWHGQGMYWNVIFISIWNLVTLAFERFLAVCYPFKHQDLTPHKLFLVLLAIYLCSFVATCGAYIQTHLVNGECLPEYFLQGDSGKKFYYAFAISTFFTFYAVPCSLFIVLYGSVVVAFRRRSRSQLAASRVINKATSQLTKTAVVVTAIFIVAIGYDLWYYLLGYAHVVEYVVGSPIQKVGIWLSSFNSVANPFVYALLVPAYRKSIQNTFGILCDRNNKGIRKTSNDTQTSDLPTKEI